MDCACKYNGLHVCVNYMRCTYIMDWTVHAHIWTIHANCACMYNTDCACAYIETVHTYGLRMCVHMDSIMNCAYGHELRILYIQTLQMDCACAYIWTLHMDCACGLYMDWCACAYTDCTQTALARIIHYELYIWTAHAHVIIYMDCTYRLYKLHIVHVANST